MRTPDNVPTEMRLPYTKGGSRAFYLDLEEMPQEKRLLLAANPPKWASANDVRYLVDRSFALRYADIRGMSHYAELARILASALRWTDADHQDAKGEAWIQQAGVFRMLGSFSSSHQAFAKAREELSRGSLRPDLQARLWEWNGSLLRDQQKFHQAEGSLSVALRWHTRAGYLADSHRCLVARAICAGYGGKPARAVRLAERAVNSIDSKVYPDLTLAAVIALCWFLVDRGDPASAHACYVEGESLHDLQADELVQAHLAWLRAHIYRGLGLHQSAETLYRRAAHGFTQQNLTFNRALVLLDLCNSLAVRSMRKEIAAIAVEILPEFVRIGLRREIATCRRWLLVST